MKSVYIGIPAYGGVEAEFLNSVLAGVLVCQAAGWDITYEVLPGCSLITKARNEITARFLKSDCDCLLFLDADLVFDAGDMLRLLERPEDVIGSAYVRKDGSGKYNVRPLEPLNEHDGAWECEGIATGFLKISRRALESMAVPAYGDSQTPVFFESGLFDGVYWGEDYLFCKRYREQGGRVWLLPADIGHVGKHIFRGRRE